MKIKLQPSKTIITIAAIIIFLGITGSNNFNNEFKFSKGVKSEMNIKSDKDKILVWIGFKDKGPNAGLKLIQPESYLTQSAIERRKKVKPLNALVDISDIPLNNNYIEELQSAGIKIKNKSKWFNRVSCFATKSELKRISDLDFVKNIDIVRVFKKNPEDIEFSNSNTQPESDNNGIPNQAAYQLNYGSSLTQMDLINCPMAHDSGYKGQGVLIASFDAGFDNLNHPVFDSIRARGLRTYDFVNHDTNVADQSGQMGEGSHGTQTLSLVGGYRPSNLISPAFRSTYILAKTENTDSETPLEEDNWIAAAEWADSLGADIITSSLGYIDMDQGSSHSYDWTWMNGDSCVITIGADLAVNKGILVCNSAGNEGFNSTHNTLGAPSDGDSVIAVGSVNSPSKNRSSFSSVGLSVDGRIKPDVCAMGSNNYVAAPNGSTGYTTGSGTSFSCPMTAGACAVILSANHNLTPRQVWQYLTQTADSSFAPNRRRGWGLINTWEAVKLAKPKILNLTSLIEEFYNSGTNTMISDSIKVCLRSNVSPYNKIDSSMGILNSSGVCSVSFNNAANGANYYLQLKHRNALETWSKTTQVFTSFVMNYNFTTDSAKAYGNNMKKSGTKWVLFEGDADQDGNVDVNDITSIYNDQLNLTSGYVSTDVNGDNFVDVNDVVVAYNNSLNVVNVIKP